MQTEITTKQHPAATDRHDKATKAPEATKPTSEPETSGDTK